MADAIGDFTYQVLAMESADMSITFDAQAEAEIHYKVAWTDSIPFMAALLGLPPPPYTGSAREPHAHPELAPLKCLACKRTRHGKFSQVGGSKFPSWPFARIIASYGVPQYDVRLDQPATPDMPFGSWCQESRDHGVEFLVGGSGSYLWQMDIDHGIEPVGEVKEPIGIQIPFVERNYNIKRCLYIDLKAIDALTGYVNTNTWALADPGCLLFLGVSIDRTLNVYGSGVPFEVTLKFKERFYPWNYFYRPDTIFRTGSPPNDEPILWQEVNPHPYPDADFATEVFNSSFLVLAR